MVASLLPCHPEMRLIYFYPDNEMRLMCFHPENDLLLPWERDETDLLPPSAETDLLSACDENDLQWLRNVEMVASLLPPWPAFLFAASHHHPLHFDLHFFNLFTFWCIVVACDVEHCNAMRRSNVFWLIPGFCKTYVEKLWTNANLCFICYLYLYLYLCLYLYLYLCMYFIFICNVMLLCR